MKRKRRRFGASEARDRGIAARNVRGFREAVRGAGFDRESKRITRMHIARSKRDRVYRWILTGRGGVDYL